MNNYKYFNYDWYRNGSSNNKNWYPNMNFGNSFPNINFSNNTPNMELNNFNSNQNLFSPKEGFERGNLFQNLYSEYKNYKPQKLKPKNEQERKLLELQEISFAAHELNLYLDTHPEDKSMLMLFNDYKRRKDALTKEYEMKFGPMTVGSDGMDNNSFDWVSSKWPWEVRDV